MTATRKSRRTKGQARVRSRRVRLVAAFVAGVLLAAALGVFLWRHVLSSRGTARDVPIAVVPAIDQTDFLGQLNAPGRVS